MGAVVGLIVKAFTYAAAGYSVFSSVQSQREQRKAQRDAERAASDRNSRRNYRAPVPEVTLVYGKQRLAGPYMFLQNLDGSSVTFLAFVKSASHEIEEFTNFYLDEDELEVPEGGGPVTGKYAGKVEIWPFLGTESQDVGAKLTELGATDVLASDTFAGMAGFIVKTTNLTRDFEETTGNFSARICGAKVQTTGETVEYSTNPAYCAADYLRRYQGVTDEEIDADALAASAAICDEPVNVVGGGTIPRYSCNGLLLLTEGEHRENLRALSDCMAGDLVYSSGKWHIEAGAWTEPTTADDYTLEDIADEVEITLEPRPEDRPNVVKGKFYSEDHNDQEVEFPAYEWPRGTGEPERVLDLSLPLVSDHRQAQRIAKIRGEQARAIISASMPLTVRGLEHKPNDVCRYELPRLGPDLLVARVNQITRTFEQTDKGLVYRVVHAISEASADQFAWDETTEEKELPLSTLEFSSGLSKTPTDLELTGSSLDEVAAPPDGSTNLTVTWTDPESNTTPLDCIKVRFIDGVTEIDTQEILPGVETATFSELDYYAGPLSVALRAVYDDNSTSGEVTTTL